MTLSTHLLYVSSSSIVSLQLVLAPASNTSSKRSSSLTSRSIQCLGRTKFKEASISPRRSATFGMTVMDMPGFTGSIVSASGKSLSAGIFCPLSFAVISRCRPVPVSMKARTTVLLFLTRVRLLPQSWTPWVTSSLTTCAKGGRDWENLGGERCNIGLL